MEEIKVSELHSFMSGVVTRDMYQICILVYTLPLQSTNIKNIYVYTYLSIIWTSHWENDYDFFSVFPVSF